MIFKWGQNVSDFWFFRIFFYSILALCADCIKSVDSRPLSLIPYWNSQIRVSKSAKVKSKCALLEAKVHFQRRMCTFTREGALSEKAPSSAPMYPNQDFRSSYTNVLKTKSAALWAAVRAPCRAHARTVTRAPPAQCLHALSASQNPTERATTSPRRP